MSLASMGWQAACLFLVAGIVAVCMLVLAVDWALCRWALVREKRAMRVRDSELWDLIRPYEPSARERRL